MPLRLPRGASRLAGRLNYPAQCHNLQRVIRVDLGTSATGQLAFRNSSGCTRSPVTAYDAVDGSSSGADSATEVVADEATTIRRSQHEDGHHHRTRYREV